LHSLLIRNARIAHPDGSIFAGDIACESGLITRIAGSLDIEAVEAIDAQGKLLLPGVIDAQVHFREPGQEHKEDLGSGSRAAVKGGVTSFLEMPNTNPPTISQSALDDKLARAAQKCVANYGFFIGATPDNLEAINTAAPVCGIKVFMGASTGSLLVDKSEDLERIFASGTRLIAVHAEDEARIRQRSLLFSGRTDPAAHSEIRDNECALLASEFALSLSKRYRRRLHILHLSTREEVALLEKDKPPWVTAEVSPNHLLLNVDDYAKQGTRVQMNPPIRLPQDNTALWHGLHDGIIDFIATDHAPHTLAEKKSEYPHSPSGMPGVETLLPLMLTQMVAGKCSLAEIQKWLCSGPARAYGIPGKGIIAEGWDADLTLVDLATREARDQDMFTRAGWTPYHGWALNGWPVYTVVAGNVVFDQGHIRDGAHGRPLRFAN